MRDDLLTIGRFARLCRLSVKRLRHYDEVGLLAPLRVDARSGYRYYAPEQARDALTVALLRDAGLPLAAIRDALAAGPDARARLLREERERLAARMRRDAERWEMVDRLAREGLDGYEVSVGPEPGLRLGVVRSAGGGGAVGDRVGGCVVRLLAALDGAGAGWEPPLWGLYPLDPDEGMEVAVGAGSPSVEVAGLERVAVPAGRAAVTTHVGPYGQLPLAYHALFGEVYARGLRPRGPVREGYVVGPGAAAPEGWVTRLVVAVEEGGK
ncbi:DNA-binding transcriptional regulator, MerR family [Streptomyces zhaozhouensis]|uniref:DNA-binding transcriptional regulator, MerR family n=1 Tax=Streptomyces zhaozhouensis TaxID=1300267 RepID=A0A286DWJ6_9ACTN|nr:MerR family transcriptional regulator [Streptomyces zhaozhouensis]SOD63028.1 DNA-binding transcriptional regulator, MerR family [Streptomyces zhaozhouensis]